MATHKDADLTITLKFNESLEDVFDAINNVRGWWASDVTGTTDRLGGKFIYKYEDIHASSQEIIEFVPNRKVTWRVLDSKLNFVENKKEWVGTEIVFELSREKDKTVLYFTHVGLIPSCECFEACSGGWEHFIKKSLKSLITTGSGDFDLGA